MLSVDTARPVASWPMIDFKPRIYVAAVRIAYLHCLGRQFGADPRPNAVS